MSTQTLRRLRRECAALVSRLDIPVPFDAHELCRRLARARGRPIRLVPITLASAGPCGAWLAVKDADYILYEERTSQLHQQHIILHEVGHLVCQHDPAPAVDDGTAAALMPDLDPRMVQRVLGRGTGHSAPQEQEAEMIASLILQRAAAAAGDAAGDASDGAVAAGIAPDAAGIVARLERSLEHRLARASRG